MKVNVFRVGRWLTIIGVALWIAGCIRDFVNLQAWRADWLLLLGMLGFTAAGVGVIVGAAWVTGRIVRWFFGVPVGLDSRVPSPSDVKAVFD